MPDFLTRRDAAKYLTARGAPITSGTLQKIASTGGGPVYQIFGNRALYTPQNLDALLEEKLSEPRRSTSEVAK